MWSIAGCGTEVDPGEPSESEKKGGGFGAGSVILIILIVCVVVYFAAGAVFQWKVRGASTPREFIINNEFWFALPLLVKDGVLFIAHGFKKGDYTSI